MEKGPKLPQRVWFVTRTPHPDERKRHYVSSNVRMYTSRGRADQFIKAHPTSAFRVWCSEVDWTEEPF